jgi:phosphoglycerol transferase
VRRHGDLLFGTAAAVLSLGAAVVFLKLWEADLGIPFDYSGDTVLNLTLVKTVMEHAWYLHNPDLGAPHGQDLYDYPVASADTLNLIFFRLAGLVADNAASVVNVFYVLTFPLTAVTAFVVLRRLPVSRGIALVCALLYTLLPYHFLRGEVHLFLAAYYAVPIAAYLMLSVFRGDRVFGRWRPTLVTAALCTVVAAASGSFYYSAFAVLLVAVAALLRFIAQRERAALVAGGGIVALILAVSLIQLGPTIVYRIDHGTNDQVAQRYWFESEVYGLKLTNLLLPVDHHRIGLLARRKAEYGQQIPQTEGQVATLGVVASAGFLWLIGVALAACVGVGRRYSLGLHGGLAALTVVSVLFATTGGFSTLLGVVWPQIRSWNRISIFIAFFSLAAVALLLETLRGALERRRIPGLVFPAVLAAVLAVGVFDQTTPAYIPAYDALESAYRNDQQLVASLENRLPAGASVVELPYEPFPEPALGGRAPYDPAKPYLHSHDLRWSWGAMRGRPEDWAATIAGKPAAQVVPAAREAGFSGILLDRTAYGAAAPSVEADFGKVLGSEPEPSQDGRYVFFRL